MEPAQDFRLGKLFSAEITFHQSLIRLGYGIKQNLFALCGNVFQVVRNLRGISEHAYHTLQLRTAADRQGHGNGDIFTVSILKLLNHLEKVGIITIHPVHKSKFRNIERFPQFECADGADFKSVRGVEHDQCGAAGAIRGNHFTDKRPVSGSIREEETETVPFTAHV